MSSKSSPGFADLSRIDGPNWSEIFKYFIVLVRSEILKISLVQIWTDPKFSFFCPGPVMSEVLWLIWSKTGPIRKYQIFLVLVRSEIFRFFGPIRDFENWFGPSLDRFEIFVVLVWPDVPFFLEPDHLVLDHSVTVLGSLSRTF